MRLDTSIMCVDKSAVKCETGRCGRRSIEAFYQERNFGRMKNGLGGKIIINDL